MSPFDRAPFIVAEDRECAFESPARGEVAEASDACPVLAGGSDGGERPDSGAIEAALRTVIDPELGMSVVELGLVYAIGIDGGAVGITMTLTAPGCPIHDVMPEWVRETVMTVPGVERVDVTLTFDPPWSPERIGRGIGAAPAR